MLSCESKNGDIAELTPAASLCEAKRRGLIHIYHLCRKVRSISDMFINRETLDLSIFLGNYGI